MSILLVQGLGQVPADSLIYRASSSAPPMKNTSRRGWSPRTPRHQTDPAHQDRANTAAHLPSMLYTPNHSPVLRGDEARIERPAQGLDPPCTSPMAAARAYNSRAG